MKTISGGQTGVDRAALDIAIKWQLPHGGWCPPKCKAEDGVLPIYYLLRETKSEQYSERTIQNIKDADGTLILVYGMPIKVNDGTVLTIQQVKDQKKPFLIFDLLKKENVSEVYEWAIKNKIHTLNIAEPKESQIPGIYQLSFDFLNILLPNLSQRLDLKR